MENKNEIVQVVEMNAVEMLLGFDINKIEIPKSVHKMFCKKLNKVIPFEIQALTPQKASEIQEKSMKFETDKDGKTNFSVDMHMVKLRTITAGCKMFKNMDLVRHFGCATPHQLIEKILLSGELNALSNAIDKLSEVKKIDDKEIKN